MAIPVTMFSGFQYARTERGLYSRDGSTFTHVCFISSSSLSLKKRIKLVISFIFNPLLFKASNGVKNFRFPVCLSEELAKFRQAKPSARAHPAAHGSCVSKKKNSREKMPPRIDFLQVTQTARSELFVDLVHFTR